MLDVHEDRRTNGWRVRYPSGRSILHPSIDEARQAAERHRARLGDDRPLHFIVR